jgi:hypothetical protein
MIRSFIDQLKIEENPRNEVPASSSDFFSPVMNGDELDEVDQKGYQSDIGKLLYFSRWSCPDILNIRQELSRYFMKANQAHSKVVKKVLTFCIKLKNRALLSTQQEIGMAKLIKLIFFEIIGVSDTNYIVTQRSVSGCIVF